MQENTSLTIKEKTPINYVLTAGLVTFVPILLMLSLINANPFSLGSFILIMIIWSVTLGR